MKKNIPTKKITLNEARELQTDTLGFVMKVAAEMGDFCKLKVGFWDIYFANHPDYIRHIFLDNWKNYGRDTFQFNQFARVTGKGLLTTHGDYWQSHRRMVQPGFHKNKLDGMAAQMMTAVRRTHSRWDRLLADSRSAQLDIDAEMLRLGLEIVGSALFSIDFSQDSANLSQEILAMMQYVVYRSQNLLAPPTFVPTPRNVRFKRTLNKVDQIIYQMISERQKSGKSHDDLLDLLLAGRDAQNRPLAAVAIRDEIITMIIAGYETVASGMGWMWDVLGRHPDAERRIRAEIESIDGVSNSSELAQLNVTNAAISEVFRLYPPSWLITRRTLAADDLGGYSLPAGSIIAVSPYAIHYHEAFWKKAECFDLDRWLFDYANFKKFQYIPFGGGPHLCIGKPFAQLEAGLVLVNTLKRFKLLPVNPNPPALQPQVTLRPKDGFQMILSRAD